MDPRKQISVLFCLNNSCNAQCIMCHLWRNGGQQPDEVNIDAAKKFIASLSDLKNFNFSIHIIGGEPLIKKGCFEIIKYIKEKGHRAVMSTNGYLMDRQMCKTVKDSGLDTMNISLDSLNEERHDYIRGRRNSFTRVMTAIKTLKAEYPGMQIGINTVIIQKNMDDIVDIAKWAQSKEEISYVYFCAVMRPFGSNLGVDWFKREEFKEVWPQDIGVAKAVLNQLIELKNKGNTKIGNSISQLEVYMNYFEHPEKFVKKYQCNLGRNVININARGDIYLCFYMDCLGNIKTDRAPDIWFSEKSNAVREKIAGCRRNCEQLITCFYEDE